MVLEYRLRRPPATPAHVYFDLALRDSKGAFLKVSQGVHPKLLHILTDALLIDPKTNKTYKRYKIIGLLGDE